MDLEINKSNYSLSEELKNFYTERDNLAWIFRAEIAKNIKENLGEASKNVDVMTMHQAFYEIPEIQSLAENAIVQGFFVPQTKRVVIIADAFIQRPELASFVAYHELGHRGINLQRQDLWNEWLETAQKNDTVKSIADKIQDNYAKKGIKLSNLDATEEAIVDIFAAYKTQNWQELEKRHKISIPENFKKPQGYAEKLWNSAKEKIGQIFGKNSQKVSDDAVFAMLGKLEQSLWQNPKLAVEKRKAEKEISFSLNENNPAFNTAINDIKKYGKAKKTFYHLGTTPEAWKLVGLPDIPVDIYTRTLIKVMLKKHNVKPNVLKSLPNQLNNPIAIFKSDKNSTNPNGYVVLTLLSEYNAKKKKDDAVIAALDIKLNDNFIEITSVYGRENSKLERAMNNDLLYWDKTRGHQLMNSFGLQLPTWLRTPRQDDLSKRHIKTEEDLSQYINQKNSANKFSLGDKPNSTSLATSSNDDFFNLNNEDKKMNLQNIEQPKILYSLDTSTEDEKRYYLAVPYAEKDEAKALGAKWDKDAKCWYALEENVEKLDKWLPTQNITIKSNCNGDAVGEFLAECQKAGLLVNDINADGQLHRVAVQGASVGKKDGAYILHLDGCPAGYIQNYKTGFKTNWKSGEGQRLDKTELERQKAIVKAQKAQRDKELAEMYAINAKRAAQKFSNLPLAEANHPYLEKKLLDESIIAKLEIRQDDKGNLVIPLRNKEGEIQSLQSISADGNKLFEKGCKAHGGFAILGDKIPPQWAQDSAEPIIISTGVATSASIHMATGEPVIVAFQDSNLKAVAEEFKAMFPQRSFFVVGDNDQHNVAKGLTNSGLESAKNAARAVGGKFLVPTFANNQQGRNFSDFSDLHRIAGLEAVKRQVQTGLSIARANVEEDNARHKAEEQSQERSEELQDKKVQEQKLHGEETIKKKRVLKL